MTAIEQIIKEEYEKRYGTQQYEKSVLKGTYETVILQVIKRIQQDNRDNIEQAFISGYSKACYDHDVQFLEIEAIPAATEYMDKNYKI